MQRKCIVSERSKEIKDFYIDNLKEKFDDRMKKDSRLDMYIIDNNFRIYIRFSKNYPHFFGLAKSFIHKFDKNRIQNRYSDYLLLICFYDSDDPDDWDNRTYLIPASCTLSNDNIKIYKSKKYDQKEFRIIGDGYGKQWIESDITQESIKKYEISGIPNLFMKIEEILRNDPFAEEVDNEGKYPEGAKHQTAINAYERNAKARRECIEHYGTKCSVCGFSFSDKYGEIGSDFIHVHHIIPLSEIKEGYLVNPIKDLKPICPNCHAIIHKKKPPYTIEELKQFVDKSKRSQI